MSDSSEVANRAPEAPRWSVIPVLVGALLLRLWHLGARSVWTDEGSTWTAASAPFRELIRLCAQKDASPPLFYLLTSFALKLGGSEAQLRLVSALASLALVWLTYRIARLATTRGEATLAAAVTALSPFQLMYAQEARTYALVACLSVASFYLFLRGIATGRPRTWIAHALVTALALYTQSIAVLGLGVQGALAVLTRDGRRHLGPWLASVVAAAILYLPWLFVSLAQMSHLSQSHWYLRAPGEHGVFQVFRSLFLSPISIVTTPTGSPVPGLDAWMPRGLAYLLLLLAPGLPLAASLGPLFARGTRGALTRAMLAALLLPLAVVLGASSRVPLWLPRYFVFLTPFIAVLIAGGLATLRPRALALAAGALLFLSSAVACRLYDLDYTKERWRDVVRAIATQSPAAGTAALVPFDVDPFRFYDVKLPAPIAAFEVSHPEVPFASSYTLRQLDEMERRAAERSAAFDEVWVVVRSPNSPVRKEVVVRANRAAALGRVRVGRWRWDSTAGPVWATRYARAGRP